MYALFGPAGNSDSFYQSGQKSSVQMPAWLNEKSLDAYEFQCGKGINISQQTARVLGDNAREHNILLSVHAPYYISLSSTQEEKRDKSIGYILNTLFIAKCMGAGRIVVHSGSCAKIERKKALEYAKDTLKRALREAENAALDDVLICPETMGKINQLGDLGEVIELCRQDERLVPTIDFGHLHSRGLGGLNKTEDFEKILDAIENELGGYRAKHFHCHFSRIEFTKGGEKRHCAYQEKQFGPDFEPLAELLAKRGLCPIVICESSGSMAEDALVFKELYQKEMAKLKK